MHSPPACAHANAMRSRPAQVITKSQRLEDAKAATVDLTPAAVEDDDE